MSDIDWAQDPHALRKELLLLTRKELIKACKHKHVQFSNNKKETIERLLRRVQREDESSGFRLRCFQNNLASPSAARQSHHGKHVTHFSESELAAVGLSWMKPQAPPRVSCIIPNRSEVSPVSEHSATQSRHASLNATPQKKEATTHTPHPSAIVTPQRHNSSDAEENEAPSTAPRLRKSRIIDMTPPRTARVASWLPSLKKELSSTETLEQELSKKIESYGTFEVMSSLLFGFAVSVAFQNVNNTHFENRSIYTDLADILFTVFIVVVLIANAYTMIVLSSTFFYVHRYMADKEFVMASVYLKIYATHRRYARLSFYVGLVCFVISIAIYLVSLSPNTVNAICLLLFLGSGLLMIIYTLVVMTNPARIADQDNPGHRKFLDAFFERGGVDELTS